MKSLKAKKSDASSVRMDAFYHRAALVFCRARKNVDGVLYSLNYGYISSIAFDPIEKKPLYHFYPGQAYSL